MHASPSRTRESSDRETPPRGLHIFAGAEGEGTGRRFVFTLSVPWIAARVADRSRSLAAAVLCAAVLLPSFFWILRDRRVWPWDQAWYGEVSVDLWYLLVHAPGQWLQLMLNGMASKPPGSAWLGQIFVPLRDAFPSIEAALLFSIVVTQAVLLWTIYQIGLELSGNSRRIASLGILFAAAGQAFVGLSHQYFVEPLQALAVAWTILIALRSSQWPRSRVLIHLAGALLLGMMAKASTPLYILLPAAISAWNILRGAKPWSTRDEWRRTSSKIIVFGFVSVGAFGALWYWRNLAAVIQHVRESSSGEIALNYGFRAPVVQKTIVWLHFVDSGFLQPYLFWVLAIAAIAALAAIVSGKIPRSARSRQVLLLIATGFQVGLVLLSFAFNDAVEARYLFALVPYLAVGVVLVCLLANYRAIHILFLAACLAQWLTVNRASFEPANSLANQFPWLVPIVSDPTAYREITEAAERTSIFPGYDIVAIEEPWINANSFAFFAAKNRLRTGIRSYYTSLGYAQKDTAAAMKRIDEFAARFVITLDEPHQSEPNFVNLVTLPVLRQLKSSDHYSLVAFPSSKGVLIFERRSEPTAERRN